MSTNITDDDRRNAQQLAAKAANDPNSLKKLQDDINNLVGLNKTVQVRVVIFAPTPIDHPS